jgi:BioD-like phosphotransacetylase family protein
MVVLFIVSVEEAAGKTTLCAGLAVNFLNNGKKVAYIKSTDVADGDTAFMKQVPGVEVVADNSVKGFDIVLMEGTLGKTAAAKESQAAREAAEKAKARVIAVEIYTDDVKNYTHIYKEFGGTFLGVVLNKVPLSQVKHVQEGAGARLEAAGIKLLGIVPENRVLMGITVGQLAASLRAKILNNDEKSDELVENYMLGAMVVDSGLDYFGRKDRKTAILRHDRPDMQLAALETATTCLVLGGGEKPPIPSVLNKAASKGIPIVTTGAAIKDIVPIIEGALLKARFNQTKKLIRLAEIVRQNLNIKELT